MNHNSPHEVTKASAALRRFEKIAAVMDSSVPIGVGGFKIGIDPILGLIPVIGDLAGFTISAYTVLLAARAGAKRATLVRMMINLGLETVIGAVPLLGDLFDFTFKANQRNLELLKNDRSLGPQRTGTNADQKLKQSLILFLFMSFSLLILLVLGALSLLIYLLGLIS